MPTRLSILVLDESGVTTRALEDLAAREGLRLQTFRDPPAAVRAAADRSSRPDAIVVDWNGALKEALSLVADFRALLPAVPVILAARDTGAETCLQAMRAGASDVLTRPIDPAEIRAAVIRVRTARPEVERHHGSPADGLDLLLGASRGMERVRDMVARVAPEDVTVLIRGESGTGKDFVAHSIHAASRRASKPFVTVDCGAIARNLIESELFGHEKGSFTGAIARNEGLFHKANAGTLFLDEVGEIPVELQPTLLRAIEEKRFRPVGGTQMVTSDARIISATNRDLEKAVETEKAPYWMFLALIHGALGERDRALDSLERALENRAYYFFVSVMDPAVDPLRSTPRFSELMERHRLPPGLLALNPKN